MSLGLPRAVFVSANPVTWWIVLDASCCQSRKMCGMFTSRRPGIKVKAKNDMCCDRGGGEVGNDSRGVVDPSCSGVRGVSQAGNGTGETKISRVRVRLIRKNRMVKIFAWESTRQRYLWQLELSLFVTHLFVPDIYFHPSSLSFSPPPNPRLLLCIV